MTRELRQVFGRIEAVGSRAARAGKSACAGPLLAVVALTGCLVTGNTDLPRPSDVPILHAQDPATLARVPSTVDPDCSNLFLEPAMQFKVSIRYADTKTDNLFLQLAVNGNLNYQGITQQLRHNPIPTDVRVPMPLLCVKLRDLTSPCNLVQVVVSSDNTKAQTFTGLEDSDTDFVQWYVLPSASGPDPDATRDDCLPPLPPIPDGGV